MNLLHLDSSILGDNSVSRQLSAEIVNKIKYENQSIKVTYHDLAANPLSHLTLDAFATEQAATLMAEFKAADIIVIGSPMYNFGIPSQLKAWIDRIAVAGQTFRYTEKGPEGLMGGKRVIIAASSGGFYGPQAPTAALNHQSVYLTHVFNFLGITDIEVIAAEGVAMGDEARATAITGAKSVISQLSA
jgi:FMN-dependent NADH-azoreductase